MTTQAPASANQPDCEAIAGEFARRLPGLGVGVLRQMLQVLQQRLGTADEQPCDLERSRVLGHEISNRLTALNLERDLRRLDDPSAPVPI